jgi:thiol-disulfide isomerase/thioredoxin
MGLVCAGAVREGDTLPDLGAFGLEGKLPETIKGRVVLVDFWASWCPPCRKSFPALEELHRQYAEKGLTIIAVNVDEKREDMERFLQGQKVSFATVRDAEQKLVAAVDVKVMPTSLVVDRAGKVRFVHSGFAGEETVKQYRKEIEGLLSEEGR